MVICGKREGQAAKEEKQGRLPHVLSTPRSGWEALRLSQGTPSKPSGARPRALSFFRGHVPPSQRGTRRPAIARGAHHFPIPGRTRRLRSPAGRSILTWGTRPTAALAVRTHRLAALTRAPPRPGAGPQLFRLDLSLSSRELASPPPGARSRGPPGNPGLSRAGPPFRSPRPRPPTNPKRYLQTSASEGAPWVQGRGPVGRPRPPLLPFGSSAGRAHVTAAAVAELGNWSGDAGRGRVHSRGSQSKARVVKKKKKKNQEGES